MTAEQRTRRALVDILGFADEITLCVTSLGEQNFYDHRPTQLVAEALLHRIGDAVSRLDSGFLAAHPEIEWKKMKGLRNVVAHEYGFIDNRIVWRALSDVLPHDVAAIPARSSDPGPPVARRFIPLIPVEMAYATSALTLRKCRGLVHTVEWRCSSRPAPAIRNVLGHQTSHIDISHADGVHTRMVPARRLPHE